jgi:Alginate export
MSTIRSLIMIRLSKSICCVILIVCSTWTTNVAAQQTSINLSDNQATVQPAPIAAPQVAGQIDAQSSDEAQKNSEEDAKAAEKAKKAAEALDKKIGSAHKLMFFDNDFSYLCDPNYCEWYPGDSLKRLCLPGNGWFDIGGQYRIRSHFEQNMRGTGLTGVDDQFLLHRTRLYGDFHFSPDIRVFAEMLDAESNYEGFAPRGIEVNRADMQNLFVDARLWHDANGTLSTRVGRQELVYGAQRVVSPLDWANTRRNFEGAKVSWTTKKWTLDSFWTNPIRTNPNRFDSPDRDQEFMGLYSTYKTAEKQTFDMYGLRYLNGRGTSQFAFNTLGMRSQGDIDGRLWDLEGAYQYGENNDSSDHSAAMLTAGLGRKWSKPAWQPTLWAYYDWASGGNALGANKGFHHQFPLGHKYNGFMDLFGRSNIRDANLLLTFQPQKKVNATIWYHYFALAKLTDTPYSVVMAPFNAANAPGSRDLGHELDFLFDINVTKRQAVTLGYSHFFAGDYYRTTAGVPYSDDADFYYAQWTLNF